MILQDPDGKEIFIAFPKKIRENERFGKLFNSGIQFFLSNEELDKVNLRFFLYILKDIDFEGRIFLYFDEIKECLGISKSKIYKDLETLERVKILKRLDPKSSKVWLISPSLFSRNGVKKRLIGNTEFQMKGESQ